MAARGLTSPPAPPRAGSGADRSGRHWGVGAGLWPAPKTAVGEGSALDALAARVGRDPAPGRAASIARAEPSPTVRMTAHPPPATTQAGVLVFCASCPVRSVPS